MPKLFSRAFVGYAAERGLKTVAQSLIALLVGSKLGLLGVDWTAVLSVAGLAGLVSVLTSVTATSANPVADAPAPAEEPAAQPVAPPETLTPADTAPVLGQG